MNKDMTLNDYIIEHCSNSMDNALASERYPIWKRSCPELSDIDFIRFGLLRCMSQVDSGRHFLQNTSQVQEETLPHSTYFKSLKSPRRTSMIEAIEKQSYMLHCKHLDSEGVDYLSDYPELDDLTVEAADGHFIDHAYHTKKGCNNKAYAAGFIYAMNLRNGLLRPICCVTNGTQRSHEIPALRRHIDKHNNQNGCVEKNLYVYDKAATDYAWWNKQKQQNNFIITVMKDNSVATYVESIPFDENDKVNIGVESYSVYENNGVKFSVVQYCDPETEVLHRFVTTLPEKTNPGVIAILYYKRWTIEKAFNNSKSNLKEKKAWSPDFKALKNQMRLTAMAYNLARVFEEKSRIQDSSLVHPSEKKYTESLKKRDEQAQRKGGFVNPLLFSARLSRISSFTIRAIQNSIITKKSLAALIEELASRLVPACP
jgi:hypothetical protein